MIDNNYIALRDVWIETEVFQEHGFAYLILFTSLFFSLQVLY